MLAGDGRGGMLAGDGRGPAGVIPNGLLPALRAGGRGVGCGFLPSASRRCCCCWACRAARAAASCSAFRAAARASAAASSMSWALAGFARPGGGPGTGPRLGGPGLATGRAGAGFSSGGAALPSVWAAFASAASAAAARRRHLFPQPAGHRGFHRARRRFHELAHVLQLGEHGLARHAEFLRKLVYAGLTCHCTPQSEAARGRPAATSLVHLKPGHRSDFIVCSSRSSCLQLSPWWVERPGSSSSTNAPASGTLESRNARPKARRRCASARQSGLGCRCAPRPGKRR